MRNIRCDSSFTIIIARSIIMLKLTAISSLLLLVLTIFNGANATFMVVVNITARPSSNASLCVGGSHIGLIDTSVQLQYREILTGSIKQWNLIANIPVNRSEAVVGKFNVSIVQEGVQLRLLQFEHGGGGCNCWEVLKFELMLENRSWLTLMNKYVFFLKMLYFTGCMHLSLYTAPP